MPRPLPSSGPQSADGRRPTSCRHPSSSSSPPSPPPPPSATARCRTRRRASSGTGSIQMLSEQHPFLKPRETESKWWARKCWGFWGLFYSMHEVREVKVISVHNVGSAFECIHTTRMGHCGPNRQIQTPVHLWAIIIVWSNGHPPIWFFLRTAANN